MKELNGLVDELTRKLTNRILEESKSRTVSFYKDRKILESIIKDELALLFNKDPQEHAEKKCESLEGLRRRVDEFVEEDYQGQWDKIKSDNIKNRIRSEYAKAPRQSEEDAAYIQDVAIRNYFKGLQGYYGRHRVPSREETSQAFAWWNSLTNKERNALLDDWKHILYDEKVVIIWRNECPANYSTDRKGGLL